MDSKRKAAQHCAVAMCASLPPDPSGHPPSIFCEASQACYPSVLVEAGNLFSFFLEFVLLNSGKTPDPKSALFLRLELAEAREFLFCWGECGPPQDWKWAIAAAGHAIRIAPEDLSSLLDLQDIPHFPIPISNSAPPIPSGFSRISLPLVHAKGNFPRFI